MGDHRFHALAQATDEELALQVQKRDETAFELLIERHEDKVFRLAFRIVGRREEARDIAQEVFLAFWEDPNAFKPTARFSTWLFRVTTNRSISHLRSRAIRRILSFTDHDPIETAADQDDPPDLQVIKTERNERLEFEVSRLPPRQKAAIHLRYREDLSVIDIATSLGVSFKSAESLLFRGKETLREWLRTEKDIAGLD